MQQQETLRTLKTKPQADGNALSSSRWLWQSRYLLEAFVQSTLEEQTLFCFIDHSIQQKAETTQMEMSIFRSPMSPPERNSALSETLHLQFSTLWVGVFNVHTMPGFLWSLWASFLALEKHVHCNGFELPGWPLRTGVVLLFGSTQKRSHSLSLESPGTIDSPLTILHQLTSPYLTTERCEKANKATYTLCSLSGW